MFLILAPEVPLSLLNMCIARTGALLRDGHYQQNSGKTNPFAYFPPHVVDALFRVLVLAEKDEHTTRLDMLRPLLTSGRLTDFAFPFGGHELVDAMEIFSAVPVMWNVRRLHVIPKMIGTGSLRDISFSTTMKNFLSKCPNIEDLSIPGEVLDDQVFLRHPKLKVLHVSPVRPPNSLVLEIENSFVHYNLTEIWIGAYPVGWISKTWMAKILECCPNLASVGSDIAGALELLHERQLYDGDLSKRYKLQQYELHFPSPNKSLLIASKTCPKTTDLTLNFLEDLHPDVEGLTSFVNVKSLSVRSDHVTDTMDFHPGLCDALKVIGSGIKRMTLVFVRVDFETIGSCCPNLTYLDVIYLHSHDIANPSSQYFTKLKDLHLMCESDTLHVKCAELQLLLGHCKELESLFITNVGSLTDQLLDRLLQVNSLVCLKSVALCDCSLTQQGIRLLLEKCHGLGRIYIYSLLVPSEEDFAQIVKNFEPNAHVSCWYPIVRLLNSFPVTERKN